MDCLPVHNLAGLQLTLEVHAMLISLPMYGGEFRRYNSALDRVEYATTRQGRRVVIAGKGSRAYEREQSCFVQDSDWFPCVYQNTEELAQGRALAQARKIALINQGKRALLARQVNAGKRVVPVTFDGETLTIDSKTASMDTLAGEGLFFPAGRLDENGMLALLSCACLWCVRICNLHSDAGVRIFIGSYDEDEEEE